jgi:DNA-binding PadR family transcriptional regulator
MYELMVLSLLMRSPLHGYLIVKITNDMIGPWAKISRGNDPLSAHASDNA